MRAREFWRWLNGDPGSGYGEADPPREQVEVTAHLMGSKVGDDLHAPVFDLDYTARLYQSSTPGHFHLTLDKTCTWEQYLNVLRAMRDAGLIQPGFVSAAEMRGQAFLRLPWVSKPAPVQDAPF